MKNYLTILLILTLFSCEKEDVEPVVTQSCESNCGHVTSLDENGSTWSMSVKNDCTDNVKTFETTYQTYYFTTPGDHVCVPNQETW